jgi:uncharacterized coiled-coil protein SlyX
MSVSVIISNYKLIIDEQEKKISELEITFKEKDKLLSEKHEKIAFLYQEIIDLKSKTLLLI